MKRVASWWLESALAEMDEEFRRELAMRAAEEKARRRLEVLVQVARLGEMQQRWVAGRVVSLERVEELIS